MFVWQVIRLFIFIKPNSNSGRRYIYFCQVVKCNGKSVFRALQLLCRPLPNFIRMFAIAIQLLRQQLIR